MGSPDLPACRAGLGDRLCADELPALPERLTGVCRDDPEHIKVCLVEERFEVAESSAQASLSSETPPSEVAPESEIEEHADAGVESPALDLAEEETTADEDAVTTESEASEESVAADESAAINEPKVAEEIADTDRRALAQALGSHGVRVAAVAPGFVATEMAEAVLASPRGEGIRAQSPFGRVGMPDEVAAAVHFLASEDGAWCTGSVLDCNGASYLH